MSASSESTRLDGYDIFLDQEIDVDGYFIEKRKVMDKSEPIDLDQDMDNSNWLAVIQEKLGTIDKSNMWAYSKVDQESNWCEMGLQVETKVNGEIAKHMQDW